MKTLLFCLPHPSTTSLLPRSSWLLHPSEMKILKAKQMTALQSSVLSQMTILQLKFLCSFASRWFQLSLLLRLPNRLTFWQLRHHKMYRSFCCFASKMIQQVRSRWRLTPSFFCCTASERTQQLWLQLTPNPSFIWLLRSFKGLRLPKQLLILFQFWRENIRSQKPIEQFIKISKRNSVKQSKWSSVELSKQNSAECSKHNSIKSLQPPFATTLSSWLIR